MSDPTKILACIDYLTRAGYTIGRPVGAPSAPVATPAPVQAAPFGFKLDGTPKKSAAGRPPTVAHAHAATPAPAVSRPVPVAAAPAFDLMDLDFATPAPVKAAAPKAAPAPAPVKAAAPAAPAPKAAPAPAPVKATQTEDDILSDLDSLLG